MAKREPKVLKEPTGFLAPMRKKWRKAKTNPIAAFFLDTLVILVSAILLSLFIKTFLLRSFFIPSASMYDTLQINDRIIVNELVPNIVPLQRGDVVVFKDPGGWLCTEDPRSSNPCPDTANKPKPSFFTQISDYTLSLIGLAAPDSDQHLVKRVIGVAGDHVKCCDINGRITINGVAINETPYLAEGTAPSNTNFDVVVPKDSFWVMGDNRSNSEDSRYHPTTPGKGFVNRSFVVGRAFVISWPAAHWTWLDDYANVFKNVPNPKP
jgi:signal peptidase I